MSSQFLLSFRQLIESYNIFYVQDLVAEIFRYLQQPRNFTNFSGGLCRYTAAKCSEFVITHNVHVTVF